MAQHDKPCQPVPGYKFPPRSFGRGTRRVKTYLRSTMNQERLNDLMLLHVHKNETDSLDLTSVAKEFVASKEQRKTMFGTFY